MTATCLNTKGIEAVLRICCCASGSIVFQGRKTTALSLTLSTALKAIVVRQVGQGTFGCQNVVVAHERDECPATGRSGFLAAGTVRFSDDHRRPVSVAGGERDQAAAPPNLGSRSRRLTSV